MRTASPFAPLWRRMPPRWLAGYGVLLLLAVPLAGLAMSSAPQPTAIAYAVLLFGAVCIVVRPVLGVYLVVFLTLLGDQQLAWWYPFTLNLSSRGSVLYLHDMLIVSPLELYLVLTTVVWLLSRLNPARPRFERGTLFWPIAAFTSFAFFALMLGLARGGDVNVALWETRPLAYAPLVYLLATNLCASRRHYRLIMAAMVAAVSLESLHALYVVYSGEGPALQRLSVLGYVEHSASLHFNLIPVWLAAMLVVGERAFYRKLALAIALLPVGAMYLHAERRSAMVALMIALLVLAFVLFRFNSWAFWTIVPAAGVLLLLYLAAAWNLEGPLGLPAQAVKSAIAPAQLSYVDQSSNFYRYIETFNLVETVRTSPLLGQGFGHKFLRVYPLPYIAFVWAEYLPHNSVLWIWMNAGIGGFLAMLYLFGAAVSSGARATLRLRSRQASALVLTATLFVVMYAVYTYVDISWDTSSMVVLGFALALIGNIGRFDDPVATPPDDGDRESRPRDRAEPDAPFATITVDFSPGERWRWAS